MKNARWLWKPLGDLFEIGAGKTMSQAAREGDGRVPFLRTSNVLWDEIDLSQLDEMALSPEELSDKCVAKGDLLVCEGGEIGRAALWEGDISPLSFQNHLHRLRPRRQDLEPRFYVYFLQSAFTQLGIFEGAGNKTTIPNLSRNRLASLEVPHPSWEEQRAVAQTLALVRTAGRRHRGAAVRAQELKRAAMWELFTCGLQREPQKDTEIGLVPKNWEVRRLGEVCTLSTGATPSTARQDYYRGSIPFVKTAEIVNNRLRSTGALASEEAVADYNLTVYPPGTVLMAMYGQGKTRGQVALLEIAAAITQNAAGIQPSDPLRSSFLWHYLMSIYERLRGMGSLGHLSHLNLGYLRDLSIPLPPPEEQDDIVKILDANDQMVDLHLRKLGVLDELFESLLYRLMTGDICVPDLEAAGLPSPLAIPV